MGTQYSHLTLEERCRLRGLMGIGLGVGEIARKCLGYKTPIEAFAANLGVALEM